MNCDWGLARDELEAEVENGFLNNPGINLNGKTFSINP